MISPKYTENHQDKNEMTRVAFYDRIRVTPDAPISVIELGNAMFYQLLHNHPDWDNVGIYRDVDELGSASCNHFEYDRMIDDCKAGLIDLIVVKNIRLFSRNVVDFLDKTSTLHSICPNVNFNFICEGLDTRKNKDLAAYEFIYSVIKEDEQNRMKRGCSMRRYSPGKYNSRCSKRKSHTYKIRRTRGK